MPPTNLAEAQDHPVDPESFLKHHRAIVEAKRKQQDAASDLSVTRKAAKSMGMDLRAYKIIEQVRRLDSDDQAVVIRHVAQMAGWLEMPWGTQLSMLDAPKMAVQVKASAREEHAIWQAGEAGLRAGRAGDAADGNPHPAGSALYAAWDRSLRIGWGERATAASMETSTENERPADLAPATSRGLSRKGRAPSRKARDNESLSLAH